MYFSPTGTDGRSLSLPRPLSRHLPGLASLGTPLYLSVHRRWRVRTGPVQDVSSHRWVSRTTLVPRKCLIGHKGYRTQWSRLREPSFIFFFQGGKAVVTVAPRSRSKSSNKPEVSFFSQRPVDVNFFLIGGMNFYYPYLGFPNATSLFQNFPGLFRSYRVQLPVHRTLEVAGTNWFPVRLRYVSPV